MGPIEICNRALSQIGARSAIASFAEATKEAQQCALWYDTLREQLLRSAHWGFARAQIPLSELGSLLTNSSPYPWPFKYAYPSDALRVRFLLPPTPPINQSVPSSAASSLFFAPSRANRFVVANDLDPLNQQRKVLLANLQFAQAVYTANVTNVDLFDAQFQQALGALVAAHVVIPLTGNKDLRVQQLQIAMDAVISARVSDGNEAMPTTDHVPDWIAARGVSSGGLDIFPHGTWFQSYESISWG